MLTRAAFIAASIAAFAFSATPALAQGFDRDRMSFEQMDSNGDGRVTREELRAAREQMFAKRDRNRDGYLDKADLPKRAARRMGDRGAELRERIDSNGDGRISKEEFVNGDTLLFDMADKNSDGELDAEEIEAAKTAMRERLKERRGNAR